MPDHELRNLRRELAADHVRGRGKIYAPEQRRRICAWARRAIASGATIAAAAREVGVDRESLRDWLAREPAPAAAPSTALVPVEVVPARAAQSHVGLSMVSPAGYRVDGLSLDEVTELLRVLG
jgi:hypothetical protein